MELVLLAARLLLAAVFAVAGLAKLADTAGSRRSLRDFGMPTALAAPFGLLLPVAELAVAVALIPALWAWWGALGALTLLLLFIIGMSVSLARGRRPPCNCFGQLTATPIGPSTLARNAALAGVAGVIVWQGRQAAGASVVAWLGDLTAVEGVILAVATVALGLLVAEGWFLVQLLAQNGRLLARLEVVERTLGGNPVPSVPRLPVGSPAPPFALVDLEGRTHTLDDVRAVGKPVLLVFTDPDCGPCTALLPEVGRWQRDHAEKLTVVLLSRGEIEANRETSAEQGVTPVLLQVDREVAEAYQVKGTPSAVLVRPDGTIGSPVAEGAEAIQALVARSTPVQLGDRAPLPALPSPGGGTVDLATFRGRDTLLLFWNPDCGFCQQMLPDLRAWEASPLPGVAHLLVVSTGTAEANAEQGLASPVVLDQEFRLGQAFGAAGTPSAVLVDAEGYVASLVAVGAPAVFALAKAGRGRTNGHRSS